MTKPEIPDFVVELAGRVESELAALIDREENRWTSVDESLALPFEELRGLVLGGGKRLRPAFCLLGARAVGGGDTVDIVRAGAALEMLHAMALFHDDVIDASTTRRGRETTHIRQARRHRDGGWAGDPVRFGEGVAILVGDLAHGYADELMSSMPSSARDVWTRMRTEVNIGQYLDVVGSASRDFTNEAAHRIALLKTAKYTVERPLHIGALIAEPTTHPSVLGALSNFGIPLGIAFQMRDDVLGVFGDPSTTGKPAGDDLRESKPTALVAAAFVAADPNQMKVLARIGDPSLDGQTVEAIRSVLVETGALATTESRITELTNEALGAIEQLGLADDVKSQFSELAHAVARRSA